MKPILAMFLGVSGMTSCPLDNKRYAKFKYNENIFLFLIWDISISKLT